MPIVSESSNSPDIWLNTKKGSATGSLKVPSGKHRSQVGYRTVKLSPLEEEAIRPQSNEGHIASLISHYEDQGYEYALHNTRALRVNDRDYSEFDYTPATFKQDVVFRSYNGSSTTPYHIEGVWAISGINKASIMPNLPADATIENIAGQMMRRSTPRPSADNLVRFTGEQRDAPALFKLSNYLPRSIPQAAGAYLNFIFGIKPTSDDILRMAETVIRADHHIKRVISSEKVRQKSRRNRVIGEASGFTPYVNNLSQQSGGNQTLTVGPATIKYAYLTPFNHGGVGYGVLTPAYSIEYHYTQRVTQFCTWEYFVPKPMNIESRLDGYRKAAEQLVGEGMSAGTVWNLTPYTWMSDWLVDFGGLLHYQQAVRDNQVAATSSGYSVFEDLEITAELWTPIYDPTGVTQPVTVDSLTQNHAVSKVKWRHHKRRGGSPYAIGPAWTNLSPQQWAIMGALGLSRGTNLPIKRT